MQQYGTHNIFTHMVTDDFYHIGAIQPGAGCKIVNPSPEHIRRIFSAYPGCPRFILRDHPRSEQHKDYREDPVGTGMRHAEEAMRDFEKLYEELGAMMFGCEWLFEGINEPNLDAGDRSKMEYTEWLSKTERLSRTLNNYTIAFVQRLNDIVQDFLYDHPEFKNTGTEIRAAAFQFGVGWPPNLIDGGEVYWGWLEEAIRICERFDAVTCFHEYFPKGGPDEGAGWYMYRCFNYPGKNRVAITEVGLDQLTVDPETSHPEDRGFRNFISNTTYASWLNIAYKKYAVRFGDKFAGFYIYTADGGGEWRTFYLHGGDHGSSVYPYLERLDWNYDPHTPEPDPDPEPGYGMIWPTEGVVTQQFGENIEDYMFKYGVYGHNGLDIANDRYTKVVAVADGIVAWKGNDTNYGLYVRIFHERLGFHSFYAHLESVMVNKGDSVNQGKTIGEMGSTGDSSVPHLHFETRVGSENGYVDVSFGHSKGRFNPYVVLRLLAKDKQNT